MKTSVQLTGLFRQWKGKLQMWFGSLLQNRSIYRKGEDDRFWGRLEKHAGRSESEIREFFERNRYEPPRHKPLF